MRISSVTYFCKQASCPSAETLLSYRANDLTRAREARVAKHLAGCDFCCAETQLLAECPRIDECETEVTEIPLALLRLAKEILSGSLLTAETFAGTIYEKERLTLTDA
jgi:hypothetical protein